MTRKTILITGSTDGIGLEAAKLLAAQGHHVLLHGRNPAKLQDAQRAVGSVPGAGPVATYLSELSNLGSVARFAQQVAAQHPHLDALINNAGVFRTTEPVTADGLDVRFAVNTFAPYLLTRRLLPLLGATGRVINVSSAAQSSVDSKALSGQSRLRDDFTAYAQSKLALTMWSRQLALSQGQNGPAIVAVNPGSMLGTKMVKQGFGVAGGDIRVGAEILARAALVDEFQAASGEYFDNDAGHFAAPHPDALDRHKTEVLVRTMESILAEHTPPHDPARNRIV